MQLVELLRERTDTTCALSSLNLHSAHPLGDCMDSSDACHLSTYCIFCSLMQNKLAGVEGFAVFLRLLSL